MKDDSEKEYRNISYLCREDSWRGNGEKQCTKACGFLERQAKKAETEEKFSTRNLLFRFWNRLPNVYKDF